MKLTLKLATIGMAAFVLGTVAAGENIVKSDGTIVFSANEEWKIVDMSDVQIKMGSALDLSSISESGPAGKHGRIIVSKNGGLAFEDSPDVPRRFLGFGVFYIYFKLMDKMDTDAAREYLLSLAGLIRRQGYNIVRPMAMESYLMKGAAADCEFNPERLDTIDRFAAELKAQGVYTYLTIAAYTLGRTNTGKAFEERNEDKLKMFLGDAETRARWKAVTEKRLSHVNPYTKIAWKDDPAIACVEFYNEQEIGKNPVVLTRVSRTTRELFLTAWRAWLIEKYKTPEALAAAWNESADTASFDVIEPPKDDTGQKGIDLGFFYIDLARAQMAWCEDVVRGTGYKGLIAQFNYSKKTFDSAVRWETSAVSTMNAYTGGSTDGVRPGSKCWQGGSTGLAANYWRAANGTRLSGSPFIITETHHYFPNIYQHEEGLIFAPYSSLQGFDGIILHEDPVAPEALDLPHPYDDWSARNPVARANDFITACLFQRGDVKKAAHRVELQIPSQYLHASGNKAINTEQDKIALMTGFSITFPEIKRLTKSASIRPPDSVILPDSGAEVIAGEWSTSVEASRNSAFSLKGFVEGMRSKGILPADNLSDPDREVFQSETGEITMRVREKLVRVVTPRTEGVSLPADRSELLSCLRVEGSSIPAAIAAVAVDERPLASSKRVVLVYNTEMAFTGMELSALNTSTGWQTMYKQGTMPILMRTGKLNASLTCKDASKFALYALKVDGTRAEKLPVSVADGALKIEIDIASLKYTTPFFELVAE